MHESFHQPPSHFVLLQRMANIVLGQSSTNLWLFRENKNPLRTSLNRWIIYSHETAKKKPFFISKMRSAVYHLRRGRWPTFLQFWRTLSFILHPPVADPVVSLLNILQDNSKNVLQGPSDINFAGFFSIDSTLFLPQLTKVSISFWLIHLHGWYSDNISLMSTITIPQNPRPNETLTEHLGAYDCICQYKSTFV